jgi:hypothetical protein
MRSWEPGAVAFPAVNPPRTPTGAFGVLRITGDPADLIRAVSRAVAEIDPNLPLFDVRTMDDVLWDAVARPRELCHHGDYLPSTAR